MARNSSVNNDPFVASLRDPENVSGVKWPGPTGVPTGTFQLTSEIVMAADANGNFGIICAPQATNAVSGSFGYSAQVTASDAATNLTWGGLRSFGGAAAAVYDNFRVVSGCLKVTYIGSTSNDQGLIVGWWDTFESTNGQTMPADYGNNHVLSGGTVLGKSYSESYPVRNGICVKWRPLDYSEATFLGKNSNVNGNYPIIGAYATGLQPGVNNLRVKMIFNYEGTPGSDTANFVDATKPSPPASSLERAAVWGKSLTDKVYPLTGISDPLLSKISQLSISQQNNTQKFSMQKRGPIMSGNRLFDGMLNGVLQSL